jgi:hypothetical protein
MTDHPSLNAPVAPADLPAEERPRLEEKEHEEARGVGVPGVGHGDLPHLLTGVINADGVFMDLIAPSRYCPMCNRRRPVECSRTEMFVVYVCDECGHIHRISESHDVSRNQKR